jgi:DNA-binding transcriptional ArsR family regulator
MDIFTLVGDPARRRILEQLADGPRAATALMPEEGISQPAISRHLRVLREAGLVEHMRVEHDGRIRLYRLRPEPLLEVVTWLQQFWQDQLDSFATFVADEEAQRWKGANRG